MVRREAGLGDERYGGRWAGVTVRIGDDGKGFTEAGSIRCAAGNWRLTALLLTGLDMCCAVEGPKRKGAISGRTLFMAFADVALRKSKLGTSRTPWRPSRWGLDDPARTKEVGRELVSGNGDVCRTRFWASAARSASTSLNASFNVSGDEGRGRFSGDTMSLVVIDLIGVITGSLSCVSCRGFFLGRRVESSWTSGSIGSARRFFFLGLSGSGNIAPAGGSGC